jgi:flagella basal body P-ring formation protein FlgA
VLNLQSKRTVTGVVTGRGQVTIQVVTPQPVVISDIEATPAPTSTSLADSTPQVSSKPE